MASSLPEDGDAAGARSEIARLRSRVHELEELLRVDPVARSIAQSSPDNLMLLARDGTIRYINYTVPDLTVEQVLGTTVFDYVAEDYHQAIRECFARVIESREPGRYETAYVADNGDVSYWESRVAAVVEDGVVVGLVSTSSNITERRRAAADRDRFFDLSLDMLGVATFDGYFRRINPAFRRTLGFTEDQLLSRPFLDFVHPDDIARSQEAVSRLAEGDEVLDFDNRYRDSDGNYRWISWRAKADPERAQIHAVGRDVTERRQLEAKLRNTQTLDAVGQLAGGIAHDFNNLVLAIDVNADLALERVEDELVRSRLEQIRQAVERATSLTRQLLTFGRSQSVHPQAIDLSALSEELLRLLERVIPESIQITLEADDEPCVVSADRAQLEQVLLNLCVNARDAMPDGGSLVIQTRRAKLDREFCAENAWAKPGDFVAWRVSDNGLGISEELLEHLFEPFFTTKEPGTGTGLGLATVYGIVQQHDGLLHVDSTVGEGASFEVYLPASDQTIEPPEAPEATAAAGGSETILVAEDNEVVRHLVVEVLESAGYRVITAVDGVQAVAAFETHGREIDLLLLDVVMPRLSGPAALARIRSLDANVPAILCSGHPGNDDQARDVGDTPLINKPYAVATLLARIRDELADRS